MCEAVGEWEKVISEQPVGRNPRVDLHDNLSLRLRLNQTLPHVWAVWTPAQIWAEALAGWRQRRETCPQCCGQARRDCGWTPCSSLLWAQAAWLDHCTPALHSTRASCLRRASGWVLYALPGIGPVARKSCHRVLAVGKAKCCPGAARQLRFVKEPECPFNAIENCLC